jgi:hypothetical protein
MAEDNVRVSPAELKISPMSFFTSFASGFFVSTFFVFVKKELRRGSETAV